MFQAATGVEVLKRPLLMRLLAVAGSGKVSTVALDASHGAFAEGMAAYGGTSAFPSYDEMILALAGFPSAEKRL